MADQKTVKPETRIVQLLVRERSGLHYIDQGLMFSAMAEERRKEWNNSGFCTIRLKWPMRQPPPENNLK